jgi:hypothetical protein
LTKINLGYEKNLQRVKISVDLKPIVNYELIDLSKEFKDIFSWTYKDLKNIPPDITQHQIELDTSIPLAHQAKYRLNPNYATIIKHNIDKLLAIGFIKHVEDATWLSPIIVVLKKNGKLRICVDFKKLNVVVAEQLVTGQKSPWLLCLCEHKNIDQGKLAASIDEWRRT